MPLLPEQLHESPLMLACVVMAATYQVETLDTSRSVSCNQSCWLDGWGQLWKQTVRIHFMDHILYSSKTKSTSDFCVQLKTAKAHKHQRPEFKQITEATGIKQTNTHTQFHDRNKQPFLWGILFLFLHAEIEEQPVDHLQHRDIYFLFQHPKTTFLTPISPRKQRCSKTPPNRKAN